MPLRWFCAIAGTGGHLRSRGSTRIASTTCMAEGRSGQAEAPASDEEPEYAGGRARRGQRRKRRPGPADWHRRSSTPAPASPTRPIKVVSSARVPQTDRGKRSTAGAGRGGYARAVRRPGTTAISPSTPRFGPRPATGLTKTAGRSSCGPTSIAKSESAGPGTLVLFIVDASGSMAARRRMEAVKGAVLGLLRDAYERRDRVGVIAFRGPQAELLLPPTDSVELAEQAMQSLPTGGRTPLAHALVLASDTIRRARGTGSAALIPMPVLLTDGKANVALPDRPGDPWQQALEAAGDLAQAGTAALVLDTEDSYVRLGRAREIAVALGAEHLCLDDLTTESLVLQVHQRRGSALAGRPR